jgi:hypothetical protein
MVPPSVIRWMKKKNTRARKHANAKDPRQEATAARLAKASRQQASSRKLLASVNSAQRRAALPWKPIKECLVTFAMACTETRSLSDYLEDVKSTPVGRTVSTNAVARKTSRKLDSHLRIIAKFPSVWEAFLVTLMLIALSSQRRIKRRRRKRQHNEIVSGEAGAWRASALPAKRKR